MRANDTVIKVRNCPELLAIVGQTRKLEREESLKTIRVQLSDLPQLNEPHLAELREVAARRHNKQLDKEHQLLEAVHRQGGCRDSGRCNQSADFCCHQGSQAETAENTDSAQEVKFPRFCSTK